VLAEAKWGPADPDEILPKLRAAAQVLTPSGWEVKYAIFAKSFTRETREADLITVEALMRLAPASKPEGRSGRDTCGTSAGASSAVKLVSIRPVCSKNWSLKV